MYPSEWKNEKTKATILLFISYKIEKKKMSFYVKILHRLAISSLDVASWGNFQPQ